MKYVELHAASAFSFLQGASVPEEMVAVCAEYGMAAMALADLNGVYGAPRFHMAAKKAKVEAHIGAEIIFDCEHPPRRHGDTEEIGSSGPIYPSGAKARCIVGLNGTAEAVPLPLRGQSAMSHAVPLPSQVHSGLKSEIRNRKSKIENRHAAGG